LILEKDKMSINDRFFCHAHDLWRPCGQV
jgi:hypothetical protein